MFTIYMGVPEMDQFWEDLSEKISSGTATKDENRLYQKLGKTLLQIATNPRHPGLETHDIEALTKRYGMKVWQSYLENKTSKAMRMYWVYGPNKNDITIIGLEPHPEDKKNGAYDTINLSNLPTD